MVCIYCGEREADGREHYLPQCIGRFQGYEPLLNRLCAECNNEIGDELDIEFCRRSPEAVLRNINRIKGQKRGGKVRHRANIFHPDHIGDRHISMLGFDDQGRGALLKMGANLMEVREISQVIILNSDEKAIEYIPIPEAISTVSDLVEILFKRRNSTFIERATVIVGPGDEERVHSLFEKLGAAIDWTPGQTRHFPRQVFRVEITKAYYRALAKIGFHYALQYVRTITGAEAEFAPLRMFIRRGQGEREQFLAPCEHPKLLNGPPSHLLTSVCRAGAPIVVNMQFFVGCPELSQWRLVLGSNPTRILTDQPQTSAHLFTYTQTDTGMAGDRVEEMNVTSLS